MFGQVGRNGHLWVEERLSDYIDNRLPPVERARVERHLQSCEHCRASLDSLRWTVSLLKRAPAPALPRSFVLPVPVRAAPVPSFRLAALRLATALATLLLVSLVGIDLIFQFGGGAPAPLAESRAVQALPPTHVAQVPQTSPSSQTDEVAPMAAPATPVPPTSAPAATAAPASIPPTSSAGIPPLPTSAPQPLVGAAAATAVPSPTPMPTRRASLYSKSGSQTPSPTPTVVHRGATNGTNGERSSGTSPTPPVLPAAPAATSAPKFDTVEPTTEPPTGTAVPPTDTAVPSTSTPVARSLGLAPATDTPNVMAYAQATRAPAQPPATVPSRELPAIRAGELGLLVVAGILGLLTILAARKR